MSRMDYNPNGKRKISAFDPRDLYERVQEEFPWTIKTDDAMRFYKQHTKNINSGKKYSTLRAAEDAIRIPGLLLMPWVETTQKNRRNGPTIGTLEMTRVIVSPIEELTAEDLAHDGWENHDHIIQGIYDIWGFEAQKDHVISLYFFKPI